MTTPKKAEAKLITELPELALLHIALFLTTEEITCLSRTCKRINSILPAFMRIKGKDFHEFGPSGGHWCPEIYFDGPKLKKRVKEIKMSLTWKDQGWGNRKGEVWVQLMRGDDIVAECRDTFGIAKHKEEFARAHISNHQIVQMAQPGDFFRFMRNVGGGGGHQLVVKDFEVVAELAKN